MLDLYLVSREERSSIFPTTRTIPSGSSSAAAAAAAAAAKSSASSSMVEKEMAVCYHGSSALHFTASSDYVKVARSSVKEDKKYENIHQTHDADEYNVDDQLRGAVMKRIFDDKNSSKIMLDVEFTTFVFALAVSLYLKQSSEDQERMNRLAQAICIKFVCLLKVSSIFLTHNWNKTKDWIITITVQDMLVTLLQRGD